MTCGFLLFFSRSNHRQDHFEPLHRPEGVGFASGQEDRFPGSQAQALSRNHNLRFPLEDMGQSVKRCGVGRVETRPYEHWPSSKAKTVTIPVLFLTISRLTTAPSW